MNSLTLGDISVYRRNYTQNFYGLLPITLFIQNPLNSTDWSTDPSWYLLNPTSAYFNYSTVGLMPTLYLDKLSFNISGTYCNPMYNTSELGFNIDTSTIFTDIIDHSGIFRNNICLILRLAKYSLVDMNIQFNVSSSPVLDITDHNITLANYDISSKRFLMICRWDLAFVQQRVLRTVQVRYARVRFKLQPVHIYCR